jgi:hypothetical protein
VNLLSSVLIDRVRAQTVLIHDVFRLQRLDDDLDLVFPLNGRDFRVDHQHAGVNKILGVDIDAVDLHLLFLFLKGSKLQIILDFAVDDLIFARQQHELFVVGLFESHHWGVAEELAVAVFEVVGNLNRVESLLAQCGPDEKIVDGVDFQAPVAQCLTEELVLVGDHVEFLNGLVFKSLHLDLQTRGVLDDLGGFLGTHENGVAGTGFRLQVQGRQEEVDTGVAAFPEAERLVDHHELGNDVQGEVLVQTAVHEVAKDLRLSFLEMWQVGGKVLAGVQTGVAVREEFYQ